MRHWIIDGALLQLGPAAISFQRTRQIAEDGTAPSSKSFGALPIGAVTSPGGHQDAVVPVDDGEGFWVGFQCARELEPGAVRMIIETPARVDAVSGTSDTSRLSATPQNYIVLPDQYGIAGVQAGPAFARPFARVSRSGTATLCAQLRLIAIPLHSTVERPRLSNQQVTFGDESSHVPIGHAPQRIIPDRFGLDAWDQARAIDARVRIVSYGDFTELTGLTPPDPLDPSAAYDGWRLP